MKKLMKQDVLPLAHDILRRRHGDLILISGQGILKGERIEFLADGKKVRGVIKTSSGGRISFSRQNGKWRGLDESDFIVIVAPTALHTDDHVVSMFDQKSMKAVFDANRAAQEKAGMGELPNWVAPFHEEGRGPRGVGDGFGDKALWSEPLIPTPIPSLGAETGPTGALRALTIAEAKHGLAMTFEVSPDAVEITIRG